LTPVPADIDTFHGEREEPGLDADRPGGDGLVVDVQGGSAGGKGTVLPGLGELDTSGGTPGGEWIGRREVLFRPYHSGYLRLPLRQARGVCKPSKTHQTETMAHPYPIREIARQSGLSEATVDRVLNKRPGVRASTADTVTQAIADLDRQRSQLRVNGRTFIIDIVMQTPDRFSAAVKSALELELPTLRPALVRSRFDFRERAKPAELVKALDAIAHRGSMGVILKAPDIPEVGEAIARLSDAGIPVVTLVTDIPLSRRVAYVGIDNRAAGATAAYLIQQWLGDSPGAILMALSRSAFRGEEEREIGFRTAIRQHAPERALVEATDTDGIDASVRDTTARILQDRPDVVGVYSIGGGNKAILDAFDSVGRQCKVFIAHDLDRDNLTLIQNRQITAVLHHDLRQDMRRACQIIMQTSGGIDGRIESTPSQINVVTPYNVPSEPVA
jgi:LacI family transcriptional regulator